MTQPDDTFEAFYRTHADSLFAFLTRLLGNEAEAEDCFQATWLAVHRHHHRLTEHNRPEAWLYRIARNTAADSYRKRTRQRTHVSELGDSHAAHGTPQPDQVLSQQELAQAIAATVAALSPKVRTAYHLRIERELPFAEIAAMLDEPADRIAGRVRLALSKLKAVVHAYERSP